METKVKAALEAIQKKCPEGINTLSYQTRTLFMESIATEFELGYKELYEEGGVYQTLRKEFLQTTLKNLKGTIPMPLYGKLGFLINEGTPGRFTPEQMTKVNVKVQITKAIEKANKANQIRPAGAVLKMAEAYNNFYLWQESYADYTMFYLPAEKKEGFNIEQFTKNAFALCEPMRTANGMAGVGSTYEAEVLEMEGEVGILFTVRSSIAD